MRKGEIPGFGTRLKTNPELKVLIDFWLHNTFGQLGNIDSRDYVSSTVPLSNNYKVLDPDALPEMPSCVECGG